MLIYSYKYIFIYWLEQYKMKYKVLLKQHVKRSLMKIWFPRSSWHGKSIYGTSFSKYIFDDFFSSRYE